MSESTHNWLIYEHLIHNCYSETALAFGSSCHLGVAESDMDDRMEDVLNESSPTNSPAQDSMPARKSITLLITRGNIKDAIDLCNSEFPNSLSDGSENSRYILFLLECQQFIEFLRESSTKAFQFAQEGFFLPMF
jgi:hypothetical protein